jgi:P4 family phage/plasmid primase-like protien
MKTKKQNVTITAFDGVKGDAVYEGKRFDYGSWDELYKNAFEEHKLTNNKNALPVYVLGEFNEYPAHRKDKNVKLLHGLVLDFDNDYLAENGSKIPVEDPIHFQEVVDTLNRHGLHHIAHTSHSNMISKEEYGDKAVPKVRALLPFEEPLEPELIPAAFSLVHGYFNFRPGIDSCGKRVSQPYFTPSCPKKMKSLARSEHNHGSPLKRIDISQELQRIEKAQTKKANGRQKTLTTPSKHFTGKHIDLPAWIQEHEIEVHDVKKEEDDTIYVLKICPFNDEHDDCSAAIGQLNSGEIWFKCHHNGCGGKKWRDLWGMLDPTLYGRSSHSYEKLLDAAKTLIDDTKEIDRFIEEVATSDLSAIQREKLCKIAAKTASVTVKAIRDDVASRTKESSNNPDIPAETIAARTLKEIGEDNIIFSHGGFWTWSENGVWERKEYPSIRKLLHHQSRLAGRTIEKQLIDCAFDILRTDCFREGHQFNLCDESINFRNTEVRFDEKNCEWAATEHNKTNYSITQLQYDYDPNATAPRFSQYLREITKNDDDASEKMMLLLQIIGYSLLPNSRFERFFFLVGDGANGKSVFLGILREILGTENVSAVNVEDFANNFYRAQLHAKLANIVTEISEGAVLPEAPIKAIVSGELLTADHKFKDPFNFRPYATLIFATNHLPHTRDYSDAIYRRVEIIPFNRKFEGEECDPLLLKKLTAEIPGIVNMALKALANVMTDGRFAEPSSSRQAKDDWRLKSDQVRQFIEECCIMPSDQSTEAMALEIAKHTEKSAVVYRVYLHWANRQKIRLPVSHKAFTQRLKRFGVNPVKSSKGGERLLQGIKLKSKFRAFH